MSDISRVGLMIDSNVGLWILTQLMESSMVGLKDSSIDCLRILSQLRDISKFGLRILLKLSDSSKVDSTF